MHLCEWECDTFAVHSETSSTTGSGTTSSSQNNKNHRKATEKVEEKLDAMMAMAGTSSSKKQLSPAPALLCEDDAKNPGKKGLDMTVHNSPFPSFVVQNTQSTACLLALFA